MTPRRKAMLNIGAFASAVVAVLGWSAPKAIAAVDARYVHQDSFDRKSFRDSLNYRDDIREIRAMLMHLDSDFHHRR